MTKVRTASAAWARVGTFPEDCDARGDQWQRLPSGSPARHRATRAHAHTSFHPREPAGMGVPQYPSQRQDAETQKAVRSREQPRETTLVGVPGFRPEGRWERRERGKQGKAWGVVLETLRGRVLQAREWQSAAPSVRLKGLMLQF